MVSVYPVGCYTQNQMVVKPQNNYYENPINRNTEKNLAILSSLGVAALAGVTVAGLTSCVKKGYKVPSIVGGLAALATLALMLPAKLYNTKVGAFTREKEMDVFSRQKEAQASIYDGINTEIQDDNVSLADKISHYATAKMADNGNGLLVKGA